ncbi:transcription factor Adf-1 [Papilio machaon]|uniref:transcription factor Adf-1 n=1 Tax=Papilio machaon TaxID=76193 RepID=UPI001E662EFA|nr:transcription factor Adf-1 [Papilio machaon]
MDKFRVLKPETIKALIDVVRNYPEIYAVGHLDYKNAYKKEMAWKKIKEKMGMDVRTLKIKWKNLRDTYRKHKLCRRTGNKGTGNLSNWVWANEMSFIEPYIKIRPIDISSNISLDSTDSEVNDNTDDENEQNETQKVQSPEPETEIVKRSQVKRRRHESDGDTSDNIITNINTEINTERNTQETVVNVPCDRTDMEFLGYANTLKRLSVRSQALIKLQITKILTRFQLEELCNDSKSSTLSNALCNEDESYITTVQLTDLQPYFVDVEQKHTPDTQSSSST